MKKLLLMSMVLGTMAFNLGAMDKKSEPVSLQAKKSTYQEWKARYRGDKKLQSPEAIKALLDKKNQEATKKAEFKGVIKQYNFGSSITQRCR